MFRFLIRYCDENRAKARAGKRRGRETTGCSKVDRRFVRRGLFAAVVAVVSGSAYAETCAQLAALAKLALIHADLLGAEVDSAPLVDCAQRGELKSRIACDRLVRGEFVSRRGAERLLAQEVTVRPAAKKVKRLLGQERRADSAGFRASLAAICP